jgi:hypothetical protein
MLIRDWASESTRACSRHSRGSVCRNHPYRIREHLQFIKYLAGSSVLVFCLFPCTQKHLYGNLYVTGWVTYILQYV